MLLKEFWEGVKEGNAANSTADRSDGKGYTEKGVFMRPCSC